MVCKSYHLKRTDTHDTSYKNGSLFAPAFIKQQPKALHTDPGHLQASLKSTYSAMNSSFVFAIRFLDQMINMM